MAKIWREPLDREKHRDYMPGAQDAGGVAIIETLDGFMYFVRECGFTFQFTSLDQLRPALAYFTEKVHPGTRLPHVCLEHNYWRRWYERLPPGLTGGTKRVRIQRAFERALVEFGESRG